MSTVWLCVILAASPYGSTLQEAEAAFRAGVAAREVDTRAKPLFRQAADAYARLRHQGANNSALHQNEGNACMLAGDPAGAILAYHRGLRLDPANDSLRQGLAFARSNVAFHSAEQRQRFAPREDTTAALCRALHRFGLIVIGLFTSSGTMLLTAWAVTRRPRWLMTGVLAVSTAGLLTGAYVWASDHRTKGNGRAVVSEPVLLRSGNGSSFPLRHEAPLPAGTEATLHFRGGAWNQVQLADGTIGWLPAAELREP